MGRCKSCGNCDICQMPILTYDDYGFFDFDEEVMICFGMDTDITGGIFYPTDCYQKFLKMSLRKRLNYLNLEDSISNKNDSKQWCSPWNSLDNL
tara:strand:+ start:904 stop:1185 length:282 start_codon:yes stop_codon:yes gene_type:complete